MAVLDYTSTHTSASFLKRLGRGIMGVLVSMGEARARTAQIKYFSNKSDAQLAEIGLRREVIVRNVFRDTLI